MKDILFKTDDFVFSYRVAGICIRDGKVLLQKPSDDDGYAFPGGHAALGETNEQTLIREFKEETGADIKVGGLRWAAEIFFAWNEKPCHHICLYYDVKLPGGQLPQTGRFASREQPEDPQKQIWFAWVPLDQIRQMTLYPANAADLLLAEDTGVRHFICRA